MTFILKQDTNYHLSISSLFPCNGYMLLKPRRVSVIQDHLQWVCHIKWKIYNS
jgi:hypothetical protein